MCMVHRRQVRQRRGQPVQRETFRLASGTTFARRGLGVQVPSSPPATTLFRLHHEYSHWYSQGPRRGWSASSSGVPEQPVDRLGCRACPRGQHVPVRYVSAVRRMVECPSSSITVRSSSPWSRRKVANAYRRVCRRSQSRSAEWRSSAKVRLTFLGSCCRGVARASPERRRPLLPGQVCA